MKWSVIMVSATLALVAGGAVAWTAVRQDREFHRLLAAGDDALAAGLTSEAIEAFSGAVALDNDAMVAYLKRGDTYRLRGDFAAALRDLELAATLEPTAPRPVELLGDVNLAMGQYPAAAELYERFAQLDDQSARVFYKLALAHYREGRADTALAALDQSMAIDDHVVEAHFLRGMCLMAEDRGSDALSAFRKALDLDPTFNPAREELAGLLVARGRTRDAIEELEALAALDPGNPQRLVSVSQAYEHAGRLDAAVLALTRAAERYPDDDSVFAALGRVWMVRAEASGDALAFREALTALERAIARGGATNPTLALYGRALLRTGRFEHAEGVLQQATSRLPVDPRAYGDLSEVAHRLGHDAIARDAERRFRALSAGTP